MSCRSTSRRTGPRCASNCSRARTSRRRCEGRIPKNGGGVRELGIPDRRRSVHPTSHPAGARTSFDSTFSQYSYGFRPGRSAHDAVVQAQRYVNEGRRFVVDVDLEKFFDRVNHDVLMGGSRSESRTSDCCGLIRRYLEAGMMANGVATERHEGTPQGGPLSPLLANVLLDEVDKELEKTRTCLRALRRRLQRVRAVEAGGRAGDGAAPAALRGAPAPGQRSQERRGPDRRTASSSATPSGMPAACK
jgi:retron-type reverse transcriptase